MKYLFLLSLVLLSSCIKKQKIPLSGKRNSIVLNDIGLAAQINSSKTVTLPAPLANREWSNRSNGHFKLNKDLRRIWKVSVGAGVSSGRKILNSVIVFDSKIVAMDSNGLVSCLNLQDGKRLWSIKANVEAKGVAGGISYHNGSVFVSSADAHVLKIDANSGSLTRSFKLNAPVRAAPLVFGNYFFVVNINNQIEVIDHTDGRNVWNHSGLIEGLGLLGGIHPVINNDVVIVPYSSGEVYALRHNNGDHVWSGNLDNASSFDPLGDISHIIATPVISGEKVFVVSKSGLLKVFNISSGEVVWQKAIGSVKTPVLSGQYLFLVNLDNQLVCLHKDSGELCWVKSLSAGDVAWTSLCL